jgi:hypothetical protein
MATLASQARQAAIDAPLEKLAKAVDQLANRVAALEQ